jgi:hypothetical protein
MMTVCTSSVDYQAFDFDCVRAQLCNSKKPDGSSVIGSFGTEICIAVAIARYT